MAIEASVDIPPADRELLLRLLRQYLPGITVWAYGSRVSGTARSSSDLDLAVFAPADKKREFYDLAEALEDSSLTFQVDLRRWDDIEEDFKKIVSRHYGVLQ